MGLAVAAAAIPEVAAIGEIASVAALPEIAGIGAVAGGLGEAAAGLGGAVGEAVPAIAGAAEAAAIPEISPVAGLLGPEAIAGGGSPADLVDPGILGTPQPGGAEITGFTGEGLKATGGPLASAISPDISTSPGSVAASPTAPSSVPVSPTTSGTLGAPTDLGGSVQDAALPTTQDVGAAPGSAATGTGTSPAATGTETGSGLSGATSSGGEASGSALPPAAKDTSLLGQAGDFLKKNPMALVSGAGMLMNYLNQPKFPSVGSSLGPLEAQAAQLNQQGQQLQQYLNSGTLPPGVQGGLDSAAEAAKAAIRSKYAAMGGGAETSSAALTDIANVDTVKATQGADMALKLLQQGVTETQLSGQLYTELLNATLANDAQLSAGISNFASALVQPKVTLNTGSVTSS
jgi:hypothetical protein